MNHNSLPDWMKTEEQYEPTPERNGFVTKTVLQLISVLSRARREGIAVFSDDISVPLLLLLIIWTILLLSLARNPFFSAILLAGFLVRLCFLPSKELAQVVRGAMGAAFLSFLLLLPAAFLGSPRSAVTISGKVFLSVGLLNLLSVTVPWNRLTESLRFFHVPDLLIFTFDITLKYIVILGDLCLELLQALKLRSVGRNRRQQRAFSGILGTAFLKSQAMAEEMYGAMVCRGFEGEYRPLKKLRFHRKDLLLLLLIAGGTALFLYLEGAIR